MGNATKPSPIFQASVAAVADPWLQGAAKSGFGTGLTKVVSFAIRGVRMKRNGTAIGKTSFPMIGKRSSTQPETVNDTSQT